CRCAIKCEGYRHSFPFILTSILADEKLVTARLVAKIKLAAIFEKRVVLLLGYAVQHSPRRKPILVLNARVFRFAISIQFPDDADGRASGAQFDFELARFSLFGAQRVPVASNF